jgi:hypothetical protein
VYEDYEVRFEHVIFCTNMTKKSGYKKGSSSSQGHHFETVMAPSANMYALDIVNRNHDETAVKTRSVQKAFAGAWTKLDSTAEVTVLPSIEDALEYVQKFRGPCGMVQIFVTGSTHLIGGMLEGHDAVVYSPQAWRFCRESSFMLGCGEIRTVFRILDSASLSHSHRIGSP